MNLLAGARLITNSLRLDAPKFDWAGEVDWPRLVNHADGHTLTPALYAAWRDQQALPVIPAAIGDRLAQAYAHNALRQAHIRAELVEIDRLLSDAGIPHIALKGWSLVERLYPDPAQRLIRDHDFLVPAKWAEAGHRALREAGFRPVASGDGWVEKHLSPLWRNEGYQWSGYLFDPHYPRPVELHVQLWETGWRGLSVRNLPGRWAERQTRIVAGVPMQTLSDEHTLIHLAMHFAGHLIEREARLSQLLDLARFAAQVEALNWERVVEQSAWTNTDRFVYASLFLAHEIFGSPLPPAGVWRRLAIRTPTAFRRWLDEQGLTDTLTSDFRRNKKGKDYQFAFAGPNPTEPEEAFRYTGRDYQLTFMAARSLRERLGILGFAALPPTGQLMEKYHVRQPWLAALLYPRHIAERLGQYGRAWLLRNQKT
jgi:hypothetical protein